MPEWTLTKSMIAKGTPKEVDVQASAAKPNADPTCGVPLAQKHAGKPKNRLVVVGDSLSHGFQSGAIHNTHLSWPMIVAWEMGWDDHFRKPSYNGFGGLPLNIEWMLHELEAHYGEKLNWWEWAPAGFRLRGMMDEIEDWWERGRGSIVPEASGIMHNLSVYGFDLRDALEFSAAHSEKAMKARPKDQWLKQVVDNAREIAAQRVLHSARANKQAMSPLEAAAALGEEGGLDDKGRATQAVEGIETLVVMLGANNALGSILRLGRPKWSQDPGFQDIVKKNEYTVWHPDHFAKEFAEVVKAVRDIKAQRVVFGTVPHVTIAPLARGVGTEYEPGSRYFPYYTYVWIDDQTFNPNDFPHITAAEARAIDSAIDQYNTVIVEAVRAARADDGRDWYIMDLCGILDRLATRRYVKDPAARPDWWTPYDLPGALQALSPELTSRFLKSDASGRIDGGLFSLDGVHPTTVAYGLIAQEVIDIMQLAKVEFFYGDEQTKRTGRVQVDFPRLIARDSLINSPPRCLNSALNVIGWLDEQFRPFMRMLR